MNAYKKFSYYYDEFTATLDYRLWYEFILPYLKPNVKILDLACGTGTFLELLASDYECYGLDLSPTIIEIAKEKAKLNRLNIDFSIQDMTNFHYDNKFDLITCFFDSINFLPTKKTVNKMLKNVYKHLNDSGYFIFDIFSKEFMEEYQDNRETFNLETFKLDWSTSVRNNTIMHSIKINDFNKVYTEQYYEYFYNLTDFDFSGFKIIKVIGDFNDDLEPQDERILVVLQKEGL